MNHEEAIAYLLTFADFERSGRFQNRPDVKPVLALLGRLGDPHLGRRTVHVAGSKGKGSVSAMVESILRAGGVTTGLFTSPHLHDYTERIRINGQPISREEFARLVEVIRTAVEDVSGQLKGRSFVTFDLLTALGFLAFREAHVKAQVIEVGLGGRVDSTNVLSVKVAVITPLSYEHTAILGDKIERIAAEKAAIIRPGCTAVMSPQAHPEAAAVVRDFAIRTGVRFVDVANEYALTVLSRDRRGQIVRIESPGRTIEARLPLLGEFQAENAATAVAVTDMLSHSFYGLDEAAIIRGLETVSWPGRLEVLHEQPLVIADGAHNSDSARRLREALVSHFGAQEVTFIIGSGADKDIAGLAQELSPIAARVIATKSAHLRAMAPNSVCEAFARHKAPCEDVESINKAIDVAMADTEPGGLICLAGSLFVAAEAREYFHKQTIEPLGGVHGG